MLVVVVDAALSLRRNKKGGIEPSPSTAPQPRGRRNSTWPTPPCGGAGPSAATVELQEPEGSGWLVAVAQHLTLARRPECHARSLAFGQVSSHLHGLSQAHDAEEGDPLSHYTWGMASRSQGGLAFAPRRPKRLDDRVCLRLGRHWNDHFQCVGPRLELDECFCDQVVSTGSAASISVRVCSRAVNRIDESRHNRFRRWGECEGASSATVSDAASWGSRGPCSIYAARRSPTASGSELKTGLSPKCT